MGLRGPGASRLKQAKAKSNGKKPRALPWKRRILSRAARVVAFLEFLPVTKGILIGKRMRLLPEQQAFILEVYRGIGKKRIRIGVKSEPRGNGKTGLVAGLALCHLLGPEAEARGEIYSAAIDRQQAALIFAEMEAIILAVPEFAGQVNIQRFHKRIEVLNGDGEASVYEALSADARRGHGLAPSLWIYDELAQAKDRELLDNLMTAMGKRKSSLGLVISTQAPENEHPLSQLIDDGLSGADPSIIVHLTCAPPDADPFDEATIRAANPALGIFLNEADVFSEAERARRVAAFEPAFRNLRLNQRVDANADGRLVNPADWRSGDRPIDLAKLEGRQCYGGLDLSGKHDLTAFVLVFPDDEPEPRYDVVPFFWTPEDALAGRRPQEQDLFRQWIRAGHIEAIPGPVIRYAFVARKIAALSRLFDIQVIAYDKWRIDDLKIDLADLELELPIEPFGQGHNKVMAPAIEFFDECVRTGRIRHAGHPVLTHSVANAIVVPDKAGNPMIDKPKSNKRGPVRIDGAVAMVMAMGTARRFVATQGYVTDSLVAL
jgi:phage terminase large subunit-like protein